MSLNFPELFIIRKYVKIRFKNRGTPCYFLSSRGEKIKNITKIEQTRLLLCTFLVSFFMAPLAQNLIYTTNIWFNFVFGSFFEPDRLLNLIILGAYAKRSPKYARFQNRNWCNPKYVRWFFFLTLTVRGPLYWKDFQWKNIGVWGYFLKKTEVLYAELKERAEAATSSYSAAGDILQDIYSVIMAKNHQKIRSRCLVHEFSFKDVF